MFRGVVDGRLFAFHDFFGLTRRLCTRLLIEHFYSQSSSAE
jgi:hypothetical protein